MKAKYRIVFFMAILFGCFFVQAQGQAHAQQSWWSIFFPRDMSKDPAVTLEAPFADTDAVVLDPAEGSVLELNVPHLQTADITEWVGQRVSELLVYNGKTYQQEYKTKVGYFDSFGANEYVKFLQDNNILKPLSTGAYDVRGFTQDMPNLLNQGAISGRYRWLYQVPVMMTFVNTGVTDYKSISDEQTIGTEYILNIQVGRSASASNDHGLLIESWKATPVKKTP
jgi:Type-IV b secretion system, inner-membrane complex component